MAKASDKFTRAWRLVTRPDGSQGWQHRPEWDWTPAPPVKNLPGKAWVPVAYARRPDALLAMGITGASIALAEESKTALDCAKPLTVGYIKNRLRELEVFPKARRNSPKQRPK